MAQCQQYCQQHDTAQGTKQQATATTPSAYVETGKVA
jgi:hypothetical protein